MKRARVLRIDMGYEVWVVAQYMGVNKDLLVRYERGTGALPGDAFCALEEFLHADVRVLDQDVETLLHRARIASELTTDQICARLNMTRGYFAQLEEYKRRPAYDEKVRIGALLNLDPGKIMNIVPLEKVPNGHKPKKAYRPREDTSICVFCNEKIRGHRLCKRCHCLLHTEGTIAHDHADEVTDMGRGLCISCKGAQEGLRYDQLTTLQSSP